MLIIETQGIIDTIESLSRSECIPYLAQNILLNDRPSCERIAAMNRASGDPGRPTDVEGAARDVAEFQFEALCSLPALLRRMIFAIESRQGTAAERLTIAAMLAYLVNPRDIIPDDLPGGRGLIDDAIVLLATSKRLLHLLRGQSERDLDIYVKILLSGIPGNLVAEVNVQLQTVQMILQQMQLVPPAMAETMLSNMLTQPLSFDDHLPTMPPTQPAYGMSPMPTFAPLGHDPNPEPHFFAGGDGGFARTDAGWFIWDS